MLMLLIGVPAFRALALLSTSSVEFFCRIHFDALKRLLFMLPSGLSGVQDLLKPW
ncbi:hypothetical protein ACGH7X_00950 [Streptomyces sp. BBFR51]|uniref:hypothetical protein n=1 Tax=Streptomyces sp. BBFR51 TaxID=3372856 RepID=UPI0037DD239D